jgi:hypothetical protein
MHRVQSFPNPIPQQGGDDRNEEAKLKVSRQNDLNPRSIPDVPCGRCERFQIVLQMRLRPGSLMVNPRNRTAANRKAKALREKSSPVRRLAKENRQAPGPQSHPSSFVLRSK